MGDESVSRAPRRCGHGTILAAAALVALTVAAIGARRAGGAGGPPGAARGAGTASAPSARPDPSNSGLAGAGDTTRAPSPRASAAYDCRSPRCGGQAGPELRAALVAAAGRARSCYAAALLRDRRLAGSLTVSVRVGLGGQVCSAAVHDDRLGDPAVASCVTRLFRAGWFPEPNGGCVDAVVPMNFVPKP
jgi:hypothetical protein